MKPEVVFALYRPHPGKEEELRRILADHIPVLRQLGLVTDRTPILVRAADGTIIEVFEWATADAAEKAHHLPEVSKVWSAIGQVADMPTLASLAEAQQRFPHFEPIDI